MHRLSKRKRNTKNLRCDSWRHVVLVSFNSFHLPYYSFAVTHSFYSTCVELLHRASTVIRTMSCIHTRTFFASSVSVFLLHSINSYSNAFAKLLLWQLIYNFTSERCECIVKYENVLWIVDSRRRHRRRRQHRDGSKRATSSYASQPYHSLYYL